MLARISLILVAVITIPLQAQHRVDPGNLYNRVICVVPVVGKGTPADPRRPQYAPWPPKPNPARTDIISYTQQISDDGQYALVEFVARDRAAFQAIFNDKTAVKAVFEKDKNKKDEIEKELKKYKKDFDITKFGASSTLSGALTVAVPR